MHQARSIDMKAAYAGDWNPRGLSPLQRRVSKATGRRAPKLVPRASSGPSSEAKTEANASLIAFVPAVCLAWLGLPALGARAASAVPPRQVQSVSVLDRVAMHKGSHDALYEELMGYYLDTNHPQRTREADSSAHAATSSKVVRTSKPKRTIKSQGTRSAADMKTTVFSEKKSSRVEDRRARKVAQTETTVVSKEERKAAGNPKKQRDVDQKKHLESDEAFFKAELNSGVAIGLVCTVAFLFWRFRSNPLAEEAWGGIDKNFIPIREADTGETEEQKEFARKEAAKAIARAKRKEREFAEQRRAASGDAAMKVEVQQQVDTRLDVLDPVQTQPEIIDVEETATGNEEGVEVTGVTAEMGETGKASKTSKPSSPGLLAMAILSVMADDIKKELDNMPKTVLPASRVMSCGRVKGAGKSMAVRTPRVKVHPSKTVGTAKSADLDGTGLLLAPVAAALKEVSGKRVAPLISERYNKYNPMSDLHNYVQTLDKDTQKRSRSNRDPFIALIDALQSWDGPKAPDALKKYDPTSSMDQIQIDDDETAYPDPLITFIKAAKAFNGPTASEKLTKYDPLGQLEKIPVSQPEDGKEYSILQAMLRAAPEQAEGPDHSFVKALLNAEVDVSPARYDLWKAAMEVKFPEVDVERIFPIIGDIMTRLRENTAAQFAATKGMLGSQRASVQDEVEEAERRADEAEKKAMALLERIERKEDELLSKVQELKTSLADDE